MSAEEPSGREIWRLSVGAFWALVTEPLFLLADSAIVGHLGTRQLAGLGIATAVLGSLVSLCIFLAYGTTAGVAHRVGAGHRRAALALGIDGLWLAVALGALVTAVGLPLTTTLVGLFGPDPDVAQQAVRYLHVALAGGIPMLVMLAAVGVLRGLADMRTPLLVAVAANLGNIALNVLLVFGLGSWHGLGITGSALGSLIAQTGGALAVTAVVVRRAREAGAPLLPDQRGILAAARTGVPLLVRTLLLRAALVEMTWGATRMGAPELATMQLALTIWGFLAFALDGVAIAAQTLVGAALGRGDARVARRLADRLVRWGAGYGVATGLVLLACGTVVPHLFTTDPAVLDRLPAVLLVAAVAQPVAGIVFVLDGILIGAGDGPFLAWAQAAVIAVFGPLAAWLVLDGHGLVALWAAFAVAFMGGRCLALWWRERSTGWVEPASQPLRSAA
ncbi:MAG: MATE family efflux transporter [Marmoricola sp.]